MEILQPNSRGMGKVGQVSTTVCVTEVGDKHPATSLTAMFN